MRHLHLTTEGLNGSAEQPTSRFMTLAGFPHIATTPGICGGRPTVAGTRMRVSDVLDMLTGGASGAEIVDDFP